MSGNNESNLHMLHLDKPNSCVVLEDSPVVKGMLRKCADIITWGEVSDGVLAQLRKKGKEHYFNLNPPRKGYGRKGIKLPFAKGGASGYRGDKINELIGRMI
jgi:large subunit ribosomal protein L30